MFIIRELSFPGRVAKISFLQRLFLRGARCIFENQDAGVVQFDFRCLPRPALVEAFGIGVRWLPGTVEPVKIGFVAGDPLYSYADNNAEREVRMMKEREKSAALSAARSTGKRSARSGESS